MKTIYIVSKGDYSAYHIIGAFTKKEDAQRVADLWTTETSGYCHAEVEEMAVDEIPDSPAGMLPYEVFMDREGNSHTKRGDIDCINWGPSPQTWEPSRYNPDDPHINGMRFTMWARDEKHAVKIANEKRTQTIAEGKWEEPEPNPLSDFWPEGIGLTACTTGPVRSS